MTVSPRKMKIDLCEGFVGATYREIHMLLNAWREETSLQIAKHIYYNEDYSRNYSHDKLKESFEYFGDLCYDLRFKEPVTIDKVTGIPFSCNVRFRNSEEIVITVKEAVTNIDGSYTYKDEDLIVHPNFVHDGDYPQQSYRLAAICDLSHGLALAYMGLIKVSNR